MKMFIKKQVVGLVFGRSGSIAVLLPSNRYMNHRFTNILVVLVAMAMLYEAVLTAAPSVDPAPLEVDVAGVASTLMEIVRETKDPDAKWRALRALGYLRYKGAVPLLLECLKDEHHYVRANAAQALGDMRVKTASASLIDLLKSEKDGGVIEQTSLALSHLQAREAVPVLKLVANHESMQTRGWVLQAIGNLGSRSDVPFLAERLSASTVYDQESAARGIEKLANVDFKFPKESGIYNPDAALKRAKDWWEKIKPAFRSD